MDLSICIFFAFMLLSRFVFFPLLFCFFFFAFCLEKKQNQEKQIEKAK